MTATAADIKRWKQHGREVGATHIVSVCDTFSYEDYPGYVTGQEALEEKVGEYPKNMQRINEVIEL